MKLYLASFILIALPTITYGANPQDIMDKVINRYVGDDAISEVSLGYQSKSGAKKDYELVILNKEEDKGNKTLLKYAKPNFMRGSGVMVHGEDQGETLQWLYLSQAAKREPRKISGSEKGKPLFGTDIYYVDIEAKNTADFSYEYIGRESLNGQSVEVVKSIAKKADYPYEYTISWVDTERYLELKVEYYKDNKLIKTLQANESKQVENIWTITQFTVADKTRGSSTVMKINNIDYNVGLKSDQFSFKALTSKEI